MEIDFKTGHFVFQVFSWVFLKKSLKTSYRLFFLEEIISHFPPSEGLEKTFFIKYLSSFYQHTAESWSVVNFNLVGVYSES